MERNGRTFRNAFYSNSKKRYFCFFLIAIKSINLSANRIRIFSMFEFHFIIFFLCIHSVLHHQVWHGVFVLRH